MYIQKRTYSYYFRIRIPAALRSFYGKSEICFSLNTLNRTDAKLKSLAYIQEYLLDFAQKKALPLPVGDAPVPSPAASPLLRTASPVNLVTKLETPTAGQCFRDVFKSYLNERMPAEKSVSEFESMVNRFVAVCGDKDIRLYTKSDIVKFKNFMLCCPKYVKQDDFKLSIEQLKIKYPAPDYKRLSVNTVKCKYIGLLHAIFSYAVINDYRYDNPVATVRVLSKDDDEPKRLPFSEQQIRHILETSLFRTHIHEKHIEYKYIILLAIFTGARLEEICRLKMPMSV